MGDDTDDLIERLTRHGEAAIGRIAQELLENPLVHGAIGRACEAREKAAQAQELALGVLNIPSAADIERLTRRVRSVSQRLEGIEDGVDRLDRRISEPRADAAVEARLTAIEERLADIAADLAAIRDALPGATAPVSRDQERLTVTDGI